MDNSAFLLLFFQLLCNIQWKDHNPSKILKTSSLVLQQGGSIHQKSNLKPKIRFSILVHFDLIHGNLEKYMLKYQFYIPLESRNALKYCVSLNLLNKTDSFLLKMCCFTSMKNRIENNWIEALKSKIKSNRESLKP